MTQRRWIGVDDNWETPSDWPAYNTGIGNPVPPPAVPDPGDIVDIPNAQGEGSSAPIITEDVGEVASVTVGPISPDMSGPSDSVAGLKFQDGQLLTTSDFNVGSGNAVLLDVADAGSGPITGGGGSSLTVDGTYTNGTSSEPSLAQLIIGNSGLMVGDTVTVGGFTNYGAIDLIGPSSGNGQSTLNVHSAAGLGTSGLLTGTVSLSGNSVLEFASGQITAIASTAALSLSGSARVADASDTTTNSALAGLVENDGLLTFASTAPLTTTGSLTNTGTISISGSFNVRGNLINNGALSIGGGGVLNVAGQVSGSTIGLNNSSKLEIQNGSSGTVHFNGDATLQLDNASQFTGKIQSFTPGDELDLAGENVTIQNYDGKTLTVATAAGADQMFSLNSFYNLEAVSDGQGGTAIIVCFTTGTALHAVRDGRAIDVAVEALSVSDLAVTASGAHRPIRWIGDRTINCRNHSRPHEAMPVRIAAHAFGENRPTRDLRVSPGHSICVDVLGEVLIPASALINGTTIIQEDVNLVTYWHVELDSHDILLAENLPAESYLEMGNRAFFATNGTVALHASPDARVITHADFCRPFHADGPVVEAVRAQLRVRAASLGWALDGSDPFAGLHLVVDGHRIEPNTMDLAARFVVPADAGEVWLVSHTSVPAEVGIAGDPRSLGVCVSSLNVADGFAAPRTIPADHPLLCVGFHDVEEGPQRWTAGRARLPNALWEDCRGTFFLRVDLALPAVPRWVTPLIEAPAKDLVALAAETCAPSQLVS